MFEILTRMISLYLSTLAEQITQRKQEDQDGPRSLTLPIELIRAIILTSILTKIHDR
jgi:hypothetical protein